MYRYIVFACLIFISQVAYALDGNRQGLIIGLGVGYHNLDMEPYYDGTKLGSSSEKGLATSFKIGSGLSNQLAVYYVRNASWFDMDTETTFIIGISGVGGTYFLSPTAPSVYFLAAYGIGDMSAPFEDIEPDTGSAVMLGGGYEIDKHRNLEVTFLNTDIESSGDSLLTLKSSSVQFTFNYLWY